MMNILSIFKNILIVLIISFTLVTVVSCKKVDKNQKPDQPPIDNPGTNPSTPGDNPGKDPIDPDINKPSNISYSSNYLENMPTFNRYQLNVVDNQRTYITSSNKKINYDAKSKLEAVVSQYLVNFGITNFKLPLAYNYPDNTRTIYISDFAEDINDYMKSLDDIFVGFVKDIYLTTSYSKVYNGKVFKIEFLYDERSLTIMLPGSSVGWDIEKLEQTNNNNLYRPNIPKNVKITGYVNRYANSYFTSYLMDDEFVLFNDDYKVYYNLKDNYYYKIGKDNVTNFYPEILDKTYDQIISDVFDSYKQDNTVYALGYIFACHNVYYKQVSFDYPEWHVPNLADYNNYKLLDYSYINNRKVAHLEANVSPLPYESWIDVDTGIVLMMTQKVGKEVKTLFECELSFGDFDVEFICDNKTESKTLKMNEKYTDGTYTVRFFDKNNNVVSTQEVKKYEAANEPSCNIENFTYWDKSFYSITEDLDIYPVCLGDEKYNVKFVDNLGNVLLEKEVMRYGNVDYPNVPDVDGYEKIGWSNNCSKVLSDMVVTFEYAKKKDFKVKFYDIDKKLIKEETVYYGCDATAPDVPKTIDTYSFVGWNQEFKKVKTNLDVYAIYKNDLNKNSFGSTAYYVEEIFSYIIEKETSEEQQQYLYDISNQIIYAAGVGNTSKEFINLAEALTIIFPVPQVMNNYAILLINNNQKRKAVDYLAYAHHYDPCNYIYTINLAQNVFESEFNTGSTDFTETLKLIDEAMKEAPTYGPALQLKAEVLLLQGKDKEALEMMVKSSYYIWNDVSVMMFKELYYAIDEAFEDCKYEYEDNIYRFKAMWQNPIEEYIKDLVFSASLDLESSNTISLDYVINVNQHNVLSAFDFILDSNKEFNKIEYELERLERLEIVKDYNNYFENGIATCNSQYLGDMRQYVIYKLIEQYYQQNGYILYELLCDQVSKAIEHTYDGIENEVNIYGKEVMGEFGTVEGYADYVKQHGVEAAMRELFKRTADVYDYQRNRYLYYGAQACNKITDIFNDEYTEFYGKFFNDVIDIADSCKDSRIQTYVYTMIDNVIVNSYSEYYAELAEEMQQAYAIYQFTGIMIDMCESQIGASEEREQLAIYEKSIADVPKPKERPTISFNIDSPELFGFGFGASVDENYEVSFTWKTPNTANTWGYNLIEGTSSITTLEAAEHRSVGDVIIDEVKDTMWSKIVDASVSQPKVMYGDKTTFDRHNNIIEHEDIKMTAGSGSIGSIGTDISEKGVYNTSTGSYVYSSTTVAGKFAFISFSAEGRM